MKRALGFGLALLALSSQAFAATDGSVGATSTGTSTITVTIPKLIRVRSMADYAFGTYTGAGDIQSNDDLNISVNYATAGYKVKGTGNGTSSAFTVTDGTQTIAYHAYFNDQTGVSGEIELTTNTDLTGQSGAATTISSTTTNANLHIKFLEADLQAVNAATYTGVITLLFTPV